MKMKKHLVAVLLCALALGACSRPAERSADYAGSAVSEKKAPRTALLAYEHHIEINAEAAQLPALVETAQKLCHASADDACVVLESRIGSGELAYAKLKFRAKGSGIAKLIAALSKHGELVNRSTIAEDLGAPIHDGAKKLQMLKNYRDKLEALQGKAATDLDSLVRLTRELAEVQSQIEELDGTQAKLMQRVDTEILHVNISTLHQKSVWRPVSDASSEFGNLFAHGVGTAISATAFLLPWIFLLSLLTWGVRALWRRWRKRASKVH
jgi:hypothetical protein